MNNTRTTQNNQPETCCETPEVWVVNSGQTFRCMNCDHESDTGERHGNLVWENQFR